MGPINSNNYSLIGINNITSLTTNLSTFNIINFEKFNNLTKFIFLSSLLILTSLGIWKCYHHFYPLINQKKKTNKVDKQPSTEQKPKEVILKKTADKIETIIEKLELAKSQGQKLGLFVGRTHLQSVPSETGWVWTSLDEEPVVEIAENRLHLNMNFCDANKMSQIKNLFDKVVVDCSVAKFINKPWETLKSLLVKEPHAELISNEWIGSISYDNINVVQFDPANSSFKAPFSDLTKERLENQSRYESWVKNTGEAEVNRLYDKYLAEMPQKEKDELIRLSSGNDREIQNNFKFHILKINNLYDENINDVRTLLDKIKTYLLDRFDHVELRRGRYPYRSEDIKEYNYWYVKGPK